MSPLTLKAFNALDRASAMARLRGCCGSTRWCGDVTDARPFASLAALRLAAARAWTEAADTDRLEAFAAHPMIGDLEVLRARFAGRAHAEQGQVLQASDETLTRLAELNAAYRRRHGFIFIVCASGRSAEEMLDMLESRFPRSTAEEMATAAAEQAAITDLRLGQLFAEQAP